VIFLVSKNIYLATGVAIAFGLAQLAWCFARKTPVGPLQWAALGLVVVFGSATLLTRNAHFIMFKPTAIDLVLAAVMLKKGWMERYVPEDVRVVARPLLDIFGYVWAGLMAFTAALNLLLVFTVDPTVWANFNLFFPPISITGLFLVQNTFMRSRRAMAHYDLPEADTPPV
jgi:intracellular septation protein A